MQAKPYYYWPSHPIPVDQYGRCVVAPVQKPSNTKSGRPKTWGCTSECKQLTKEEYDIILDTKDKFSDDSIQNMRNMLLCIDECPHSKYPKVNGGIHEDMHVNKMGHSMLCTDGYSSVRVPYLQCYSFFPHLYRVMVMP